jgi:hypothetical protein
MSQFTDTSGRTWTLALDGLALKDLRDQLQIDLADVVNASYVQLERDPALLTAALAHLLTDQIKAAGITPRQFSAAMIGRHLDEAFAALWGAAEAFFPAKLWSVLSSLYDQQKREETVRLQIKQLGLLNDMPQEIRDSIYAQIGKSLPNIGSLISAGAVPSASGLASTPSTVATSSPASSESTPAA